MASFDLETVQGHDKSEVTICHFSFTVALFFKLTNFRINSKEVHNPNKNMQIPFKGSTETSLK